MKSESDIILDKYKEECRKIAEKIFTDSRYADIINECMNERIITGVYDFEKYYEKVRALIKEIKDEIGS